MPTNRFLRASLVASAALVWSCSDGPADKPTQDAGTSLPFDSGVAPGPGLHDGATGSPDASGLADAAVAPTDATLPPAERLKACLERPGELARPTSATLPCGLIPPGLVL